MNIVDAVKNVTSISSKVLNKENPDYGHVGILSKNDSVVVYFNSQTVQCIIPVSCNTVKLENSEFMVDGKLLLKAFNECGDQDGMVSIVKNSDSNVSAMIMSSSSGKFEVKLPIYSPSESLVIKKANGKSFLTSKECFIDLIKCTTFAGSDTDPDRAYFYSLFELVDGKISSTCGNGTFFAHASCGLESECLEEIKFIMPISISSSIVGVMSSSVCDQIKVSVSNNLVGIYSDDYKINIFVDQNAASWPNARSIMNRQSGKNINILKSNFIAACKKIDIAIEGFESKSETLKCNMSIKDKKLSLSVDSYCSVKCDIDIENEELVDHSLFFDAACLSMVLKTKNIGENIVINIEDSVFNGRSSPILFSSSDHGFVSKSFFAVNV